MGIDDLIKKCNCSVQLFINQHRDYYETIDQKIAELGFRISDDEKRLIRESGCVVELIFYPDTPIGSIRIVSHSIEDALKQAHEYFTEEEASKIIGSE